MRWFAPGRLQSLDVLSTPFTWLNFTEIFPCHVRFCCLSLRCSSLLPVRLPRPVFPLFRLKLQRAAVAAPAIVEAAARARAATAPVMAFAAAATEVKAAA